MKHFAKSFLVACRKAKVTQKGAAELLGISAAYLSDVLSGRRKVSIPLALKVEKAFGINAERVLIRQLRDELEDARAAVLAEQRGGRS